MTRKKFIDEYTRFIKRAMKLAEKAIRQGIASLEDEVEDIDDELFKHGLRFVIDGVEPRLIDEIMSNRIAHDGDRGLLFERNAGYNTLRLRVNVPIL